MHNIFYQGLSGEHGCPLGYLFILAGNDDMHESLDEFEIRPDSTTDYGVSCP